MKNVLFIILFVAACSPEVKVLDSQTLNGSWLSYGIKLDKDYYRPYSEFMHIENGEIINRVSGTWQDTIQEITFLKDSIIFPYRRFGRNEVKMEGDLLSLGKRYPRVYHKVSPISIDLDSAIVRNQYLPGQWEGKDEIFVFEEASFMIYDKSSKDKSEYCWDLQLIDKSLFLQRKGSFKDCEYPYFSLQMIKQLSSDSLIIQGWHDGEFLTRSFVRSTRNLDEFKETDFRLCNPNLYVNMNSDWYYFKYPQYDGGLYRLKQIYDQSYVPVKTGINDGLVRVEFIINCVGEIGRFTVEELNFDYEEISLNPSIGQQILKVLKDAGNWIPAERRDFELDAYKFLIFKIRKGEIEEIYP